LLEASVIQWHWLEERFPERDQFNSIHEKLAARWQESGLHSCVHFACIRDHSEDFATTVYMQDTAIQAGLETKRLFIDEIGWDGRHFLDLDNARSEDTATRQVIPSVSLAIVKNAVAARRRSARSPGCDHSIR